MAATIIDSRGRDGSLSGLTPTSISRPKVKSPTNSEIVVVFFLEHPKLNSWIHHRLCYAHLKDTGETRGSDANVQVRKFG